MTKEQKLAPPAGSPEWWANQPDRTESSGGRGRPSVPFDRIIATALAAVDEVGPEAFNMRMLAERLESGTATLYRHVASKDEILAYVVDRVLGECDIQDDSRSERIGLSWKDACVVAAESLYRTLNKHPKIGPLLVTQIPLGPNGLRVRERTVSALLTVGLTPELAARAYTSIAHFVIGFAIQQRAEAAIGLDSRADLREFFLGLDPETYPATVEVAGHLADISLDDEFRFGLKLIIDGLALATSAQSKHA